MTAQTTTEPTETSRAKWLDLSMTQLVGGSMAAATAAALGSRLGVAGTVLGAAVGSLISATAAGVYTSSLHRARSAIAASRSLGAGREQPRPLRSGRVYRIRWRRVLAMAGVLFALAAALLIGLQLASGANVTGTTIGTRSAVVEQPAPAPQDGADSPIAPSTTDSSPSPTSDATPAPTDAPADPFIATPPAPTDTAPAQTPTDLPATPAAPAQGAPTDAPPVVGAPAPTLNALVPTH